MSYHIILYTLHYLMLYYSISLYFIVLSSLYYIIFHYIIILVILLLIDPLYPTVLKLFKSKHQLSMEILHDPSGNWRSTPEAPVETDTTHDEA